MNDDLPNYTWGVLERAVFIHAGEQSFWDSTLSEMGLSFEAGCILVRNHREAFAASEWMHRLAKDLDTIEVTGKSRCLKVKNISPEYADEGFGTYMGQDLNIKASRTNLGTYIGEGTDTYVNGVLIKTSATMRELAERFREISQLMDSPRFRQKLARKEPIK